MPLTIRGADGEDTVDGVLQYDLNTGKWDTLRGDRGLGKPLVLIADWSQDSDNLPPGQVMLGFVPQPNLRGDRTNLPDIACIYRFTNRQ